MPGLIFFALLQETRARKLEKSDAMAREFLQLPPRHVEEMRAKIPEVVVERVRKMTLKFDGEFFQQSPIRAEKEP